MYLDILNFLVAIGAIFWGFKICSARVKEKKMSEVRKYVILFVICLIVLWFINIYIGYLQ